MKNKKLLTGILASLMVSMCSVPTVSQGIAGVIENCDAGVTPIENVDLGFLGDIEELPSGTPFTRDCTMKKHTAFYMKELDNGFVTVYDFDKSIDYFDFSVSSDVAQEVGEKLSEFVNENSELDVSATGYSDTEEEVFMVNREDCSSYGVTMNNSEVKQLLELCKEYGAENATYHPQIYGYSETMFNCASFDSEQIIDPANPETYTLLEPEEIQQRVEAYIERHNIEGVKVVVKEDSSAMDKGVFIIPDEEWTTRQYYDFCMDVCNEDKDLQPGSATHIYIEDSENMTRSERKRTSYDLFCTYTGTENSYYAHMDEEVLSNDTPEITLAGYVNGDANTDGQRTLADAVAILQSLANEDEYGLTAQGIFNADIVGNDGVNADDALEIQRLATVEEK